MAEKGLDTFFETYLKKEPLFLDKSVLQSAHTPDEIPHREEQIKQIANILAPALRMERPSNIFIYGKTGTGKTVCVKHTTKKLQGVAKQNNIQLDTIYVNCKLSKTADTEYRLVAHLAREFGKEIPSTGLPTGEVYSIFYKAIDNEKRMIVIVLDEIDQLINKTSDEILYNLTRINSELKNAQISIIGISNDLVFADNIDPRVKSSLSEEELVFPPYNAIQIQDILKQRTSKAFKNSVLEQGLLEKCAAYAAKDHGDARRALELIRVAGELAERNNEESVSIKHLDLAEDKIEKDRVIDIITTQPQQFKATLYAAILLKKEKQNTTFTGDIYEIYKEICSKTGLRPLTQRRISDILAEFDMLGIINAKVISKGRYGRTREINLAVPPAIEPKIREIIVKDLGL
ncbi:ORC1-type DNA replication protein [Candidatus Woesearchaeota archaeon]|nr:ORC1-type DNA replication protein [Candidatus Woesearchaeota archaeon]